MKIELELTPEQWWVLTSEAEARNCTVTELVAAVSARTSEGRTARRQSIETLHHVGMSDASIGQRLGMTTQAVANARRRLGLTPNSRAREISRQRTNQEESRTA